MELITRKRFPSRKANYFQITPTGLLSRPLFNSALFTWVMSLQVSDIYKEDHDRYVTYQPPVFTVCLLPHLETFDSHAQETQVTGVQENFQKVGATSSLWAASDYNRVAQCYNKQFTPLKPLAGYRCKEVDQYNENKIQASHERILQRNRKSKTFSIETQKRLTQLRQRYKRYIMTKKCLHYFAEEYTYYTEIEPGNSAMAKSNESVNSRKKCAVLQSGRYKEVPNNKNITTEKGNQDIIILYVASGIKNVSLQPNKYTSTVYVATECDPNECFKRVKKYTTYGNNASTQSSKYKIQEKLSSNKKPSGGNVESRKSKQERKVIVKKLFECAPNTCVPKKQKNKKLKPFQCEPGICIPKKQTHINQKPYECEPGSCVHRHPCEFVPRNNKNEWETKKELYKEAVFDHTFKSKDKLLKPSECPPGISVPSDCNLNECLQLLQKYMPYGCDTPTPLDKYIIPKDKRYRTKLPENRNWEATVTVSPKFQINSTQPIPHYCDPNECLQQVKKYRPYGFHTATQSSKNKIMIEKQEKVKKTLAKRDLDTVPNTAARQRTAMRAGEDLSTNCDPNECFQQVKKFTPYGCHVSTQTSKYKMKKEKRETINKSSAKPSHVNVLNAKPKNKNGSKQPGVDISINCDPNECSQKIKKYRANGNNASTQSLKYKIHEQKLKPIECRPNTCTAKKKRDKKIKPFECPPKTCIPRQLGDSVPRKSNRSHSLNKTLKRIYCKQTDCDTDKCKTKACYQRLQPTRSDIINAYNSSHSSATSTQTRSNRQTPIPNYRQAVRIGSTCSFDVVFYKSITNNGTIVQQLLFDNKPVLDTSPKTQTYEKEIFRSQSNPYECKPPSCVPARRHYNPRYTKPGKFNVTKSFQLSTSNTILNTKSGSSHANQKEIRKVNERNIRNHKGASIISKYKKIEPYRKAAGITSNFSSNVKFYVGMLQNVHNVFVRNGTPMSRNIQGIDPFVRMRRSLKPFDYEHGVCVPDNCGPSKCFHWMKIAGAENNYTSLSKIYKNNKRSFHMPNIQALCTGCGYGTDSKCSFNFEFYKSLPINGVEVSEHDHEPGVSPVRLMTRNKIKSFECQRVYDSTRCDPGTCVEQFDLEPGHFIAYNECLKQKKVTYTDSYTNASLDSHPSMLMICMNKLRLLKEDNSVICKDKDLFSIPRCNKILQIFNTQVVSIGSKCSCNVEFYKGLPQNGFGMSEPYYAPSTSEQANTSVRRDIRQGKKTSSPKTKQANPFECKPGICVHGKCNPYACIQKAINRFDCERGMCVPKKCDPSKCFERIKISSTDTESVGSQASKSMKKGQLLKEENSVLYKDKGSSSMPRSKIPLHIDNRQTVRIGSKCSFNVEFYKSFQQNGFATNEDVSQKTNSQGDTLIKQTSNNSRKKRKVKNPFECEPGICKPGKCDPATCAQRALKRFDCDPGVCVPGKCDPQKCFQRIKVTATNTDSNTTSQGSQASMSKKRRMKKERLSNENAIIYKDKGVGSLPKSSLPSSHAVRIGSTLSFNVEFYKSLPSNGVMPSEHSNEYTKLNQGDLPIRDKALVQKTKMLKSYECPPGVCIPRKCDPRECLQKLKLSGTETEFTSRGSQISSKKKSNPNRRDDHRHKDASVSSMQKREKQPHKPIRVRVESGFKFDTEVFKTLPLKGVVTSQHNNEPAKYEQGDAPARHKSSGQKKKRRIKPFECQRGVCIPRKCDPNKCVQRFNASGTDTNPSLKANSNATSRSSLASSKAPRTKHAVRIGSTLSFNVELYKSLPPKEVALGGKTNAHHDQGDSPTRTDKAIHGYECPPRVCIPGKCDVANCFQQLTRSSTDSSRSSKKNPYECEPGICVPGKCDPHACLQRGLSGVECQHGVCIPGKCDLIKCFQRLRISGTETTDSNATSRGNQAYAKTRHQKKGSIRNQGNVFRSKNKCVCMRAPKKRMPHKNTIQIGSKCSFNLEFYKTLPQNSFVRKFDQGDRRTQKKGQVSNSFDCKPGICVRGKCDPSVCAKHGLTGYECLPGICIPGKCDVTKCFQQLNRSSTESSLECDPGVCVPGKCDPKICLQHALNGFECLPGVCRPGKCDVAKCLQQLKKASTGTSKNKKNKLFKCDPGVCITGKCDPYECLARLKILHGASAYSEDGQAFTQTMKGKKVSRKKIAGKETLYKEKGASTKPRNKMPLHMPDRDVVRIGSKCSFNIEFYKEKPNGLRTLSQMECEPGVCIPNKCDPIDCYRQLQNADMVMKHEVAGTKRKVLGANRKVKGTKGEVVSKSADEETRSESAASKRGGIKKIKPGTDKTKNKVEKSKSEHDTPEDRKSGFEGSKRKVTKPRKKIKKTKPKTKKFKSKFGKTSPSQSFDDGSEQATQEYEPFETQSQVLDQLSLANPKNIISFVKKCCKYRRQQKQREIQKPRPKPKQKSKPKSKPKPELDAEGYATIDDTQESITSTATADTKEESETIRPSKPVSTKRQNKQKIVKEPKTEQSFESVDSEEDVADTSPIDEPPTKSHGTSAGTQSRKYPAREMMPRIKPPVKRNICDCGAKILPPLSDRIYAFIVRMLKAREQIYKAGEDDYDVFIIEPNEDSRNYCEEDVTNYCSEEVEERGVVIGSSGFFNLKLTKNDTRSTKK